jgi:hypothetical protein
MQSWDIYTGWIVAFVDSEWRKVFISPGWVTLADWLKPNDHVGIFTEEEAAEVIRGESQSRGVPLTHSPYALISSAILDRDVLDRIATVRFGRVPTGETRYAFVEDTGRHLLADRDDSQGVDPDWPRFDLPYVISHRPPKRRFPVLGR